MRFRIQKTENRVAFELFELSFRITLTWNRDLPNDPSFIL